MKLIAVLIVLGFCYMVKAQDWKPANSPLMTRWAKDVSPTNCHPEYPRPQMVRKDWLNLNGLWQFAGVESLESPPIGKKLDGQILVPFCMESALSGVGKHHDRSFYRRTFQIPAAWKDRSVLLNFGAVDFDSTVWINGKRVGQHIGGYDAHYIDITDALKKEGGEQELIVGVTDVTAETQACGKQTTKPEGIWYTPCSGIWQTVWLEPVEANHIHWLKITPDVSGSSGKVSVYAEVPGTLRSQIVDFVVTTGGKVVANKAINVADQRNTSDAMGVTAEIPIDHPRLWSPDDPFLYDLKVSIREGINVIDSVQSYFGLRKIEVSPDAKGIPRIKLNGKPIMQVGPLDQGFWPDGIYTAPTEAAMKYDLEMTLKLGFNMIRKHVKVEPQRWYYWADKMGILVWQDMPSPLTKEKGDWQKQFEHEMQQLIEQHQNSPAIVIWVPFNEGWGQDGPYGKEGTQRIAKWVKQLDPTRLVNNASGWTDAQAGDVHDIHVYPGPAAPPIEKQRAIVLGEFGGLGLPIEGHMWEQKHWGYQNMGDKSELTDKYVRLLGRLWQLHDDNGLCAGVYTQTTDVESEANGFMTYDREVLKLDEKRVREANLGHGPRLDISTVIKTAKDEPVDWKYTTEKPSEGWEKAGFDDSSWKTGKSGFGTEGTPGAKIGTKWDSSDIWLRRGIELTAEQIKDLDILWHHDDGVQVYLNGVLAARTGQYSTDYVEQRMNDAARHALKPGKNLVAVHCHQNGGGQYIDVGFVKLTEIKREN